MTFPSCTGYPCSSDRISAHDLEVGELPGTVEGRFRRAVDAEVHEPALAGDGLDPAAIRPLGGLRTEVQVHGASRGPKYRSTGLPAPVPFTGGTIERVAIDVSGDHYVDHEKEVLAYLTRD
jgi:hypothetical protein